MCINIIHIPPCAATEGPTAGAGRPLPDRGLLYLYGPFRIGGANTAASNAQFDEDLRARDPEWGVRDLEAVLAVAVDHGFQLVEQIAMPANNLSVALRRARVKTQPA